MADFVTIKEQPCCAGMTMPVIEELEEGKKCLVIFPLLSEVTWIL